MKKQSPVGLVVEGNATNSVILRLPKLAEDIGPIKSTAPRVAKRLSNFLRAGYAVSEYDELLESRLILIRAPDAALPRIVTELCSAELDFKSLTVALCESWMLSDALDPLRKKGSAIATVMVVPSVRRHWFVVEGDARAVRPLRRLIEKNEGQTLELRGGGKECYFAAELLATALPIPLFTAAQQALRKTGISGKRLQTLLEEMADKMFRDFINASRMKWGGPLSECSAEIAASHFKLLESTDPWLAQTIGEALQFARRHSPLTSRQH